jgi:hypothetical protein
MRKVISLITCLLLLITAAHTSRAIEMTWEYSVQVSATVSASPAQISLSWPQDQYMVPNSYTLYRKAPGATSWGTGTTLSGTTTSYVDSSVSVGTAYEYQIVKSTSQYTGYGYLYAGINVPMTDSRGKLLLVVDSTYASQLASELARLQQDLVGDGWTVIRQDFSRNDTVVNVKNWIKSQYNADPANVKTVFLFGHVPVPYSGNIVPDGHVPDHQGAWPTDGFYGDMDGTWTDNSVNVTGTYDVRNQNVPGDGKYDQSTFPAAIKLMVGRVDLANMPGELWYGGPTTMPSELELLRNYLNKDHNFRVKQFNLQRKAYVGEFFGTRGGEAFGASAWRNFAPYFGANNIDSTSTMGTWTPTLKSTPYLWAYGCGAGSFTSVAGLGNSDSYYDVTTPELYTNDVKAAFTLLFGSWLGDFDAKDNIMRCILALPSYGLTCAWSGRPHWFLHHMGLGETIGYGARLTQNNGPSGLYQNQINSAAGQIHVALMGDPSLRMHVVAPPTNVRGTTNGSSVTVNWSASSDNVVGYHVYRANGTNGSFTRLTTSPITATTYTDSSSGGSANYMVRAVKLETSGSGTYYNPSQGAFLAPVGNATGYIGSTNTTTTIINTNSTGTTGTNGVVSATVPGATVWVDDSLPTGAVSGTDGGDSWNWTSGSPTPYSGSVANQSSLSAGLHQHFFYSATQTLPVAVGETLFAFVYLDPNNPPSEVMLQWNDGSSWEHRAFWGADNIGYGSGGSTGHKYVGALPAAGQWALLQVPASQVGLEGSTISGMAFSQYDGRATWDYAGKTPSVIVINPTGNTNVIGTNIVSTTNTVTLQGNVVWMDDMVPPGGVARGDGESWKWTNANPAPFSGSLEHQSAVVSGSHQHYFMNSTKTLTVNAGEFLYAYVYIDPNNAPSELMLQWNNGTWEHRAYWGANSISYGTDATASRRYMGALPAAGKWTLLQVPASQVALEGSTLNGMAFTLYGGRASWDVTGKATALVTNSVSTTNTIPNTGGNTNITANTNTTTSLQGAVAWVDDAMPSGAVSGTDGGDSWNWTSSSPSPYSGSLANQSTSSAGLHQHFFYNATQTMGVNAGETLFAYVYLDPTSPPSELMLQWNDGSWEHRAYWGADSISYGSGGTAGHKYMGAMPTTGKWVLLSVPASQVGLEGSTVNGMAFSQFDGRATWDYAGKATGIITNTLGGGTNFVTNTNNLGGNTNIIVTSTNVIPTNIVAQATNALPGVSLIDYTSLQLPNVGDNALHILTPNLLELKVINTKQPDPATVSSWNLVDSGGNFSAPAASSFTVTANGQTINVTGVGFKRRPIYAPMLGYDLRIENSMYLQLASPISDNQAVEVKNPSGALWASTTKFTATANPLRYSPAIHVNQEGYMPSYTKKAMIGYYAGNLGEMAIPSSGGFKIVDATTGVQVFQGTINQRLDSGYTYNPSPYQKVYEADFTAFNTPGEYRLVVPGMGGSMPFMINDGVAMAFTRAYSLGLYHQRCGTNTAMPYTRFTHDVCHAAQASVPSSATSFPFTWTTVAGYANSINGNNPTQIAPALTSPAAQLFPFQRQGTIDVTGGHHDAGDYSKYTINSASLVHYLMFAVDSLPNVGSLDNLGIPESGDGISDVMQEAKWEADFISKMQDTDGGFYFLVYPQNREYEGNVTPDHGDAQVVWPKTTSVTAASVAALAQCASSAKFKQAYPAVAAKYLQQANLGWQFLTNAVNRYGKNGAYQKITHYGDNFADNDELAWAACQIYLATGNQDAHQKLLSWFNPADPATWRWGWWHMSEGYGHAIRSYAFAVQSGRATSSQLDGTFLSKCQAQIAAAADDMVAFSQQNAYGSSFPSNTKAVQSAGWYFSTDQAFDLAVAYQLNNKSTYMDTMLANMNYEGGCNPVNVCYVTGLGWKRQRDIVSQWALNDTRTLPPSGIPVGNIVASFDYTWNYAGMLNALCYPTDGNSSGPYPYYDRWADGWNVSGEFVVLNAARSIGTLGFLAGRSAYRTQAWKAPSNATIVVPTTTAPVGQPVTVSLQVPGMDLSGARITWEARDQEPTFGQTYTFSPKNNGTQWVEAEAQWTDGRRVFAKATFSANSPNIVWVDDALPSGAVAGSDGGDSWTWVNSNPSPKSGSVANQSAIAAGEHQHYFSGATATMGISVGDTLYAWVYLDSANAPTEVMLQWNDGNGWEHRAYWGANSLGYGLDGTASRRYMGALPASGQWVQLKVPASQVGLENTTVSGMAFTAYGGRVTWDAAGRLSSATASVGTPVPFTVQYAAGIPTLAWASVPATTYGVTYKNSLNDTSWTSAAQVTATTATTSWTDTTAALANQRYYLVAVN